MYVAGWDTIMAIILILDVPLQTLPLVKIPYLVKSKGK